MGTQAKASKESTVIGMRLKKIRNKKSLSGEQCAILYGISRSGWSHMENGRASFSAEDLFKLAKMLHVSPSWLLTGEGEMEKPKDSE